jgi:hypothetical protein
LKRFDGRTLGKVDKQTFLGLYHERDRGSRTIAVSQPRQIQEFLSAMGHLSVRTVKSPLAPNVVLSQSSEESTREHPLLPRYSEIVGSLMYLANSFRPHLSSATSTLARFMSDPSDQHVEAAVHVLRYLSGTRELELVLGKFGMALKWVLVLVVEIVTFFVLLEMLLLQLIQTPGVE